MDHRNGPRSQPGARETGLYQGPGSIYFVTGERPKHYRDFAEPWYGPKRYSIRRFDPTDGSISTAPTHAHYGSWILREDAARYARALARGEDWRALDLSNAARKGRI